VRRVLERDRSVRVSLDARLQVAVARALRQHAASASRRAAAIVLDAASGQVLASASYPWPETFPAAAPEQLLDRARYGLYPPGSTFKLVTAAAAFRAGAGAQRSTFDCARLPDGRIGGHVHGVSGVIRDDPLDRVPHGRIDLRRALVVSCNVYFASLAQRIGPRALAETAAQAQIATAPAPVEGNLASTIAHAGYGQGQVVASPLRMARVAAAIAGGGVLRDARVVLTPSEGEAASQQWITAETADLLARYLREAVTSGTGRSLARHPGGIAGKTGTAEVDDARSHAWFVGFAPYRTDGRRIAFAVIVENAGYGARAAAPVAAEIVSAARAAGVIR
jgi:peptidoglycan glycosyltransferase